MCDDVVGPFVIIALLIAALAAGCIFGHGNARINFEKNAVEAGAAEFYLDASHNRQWRWKTNANDLRRN